MVQPTPQTDNPSTPSICSVFFAPLILVLHPGVHTIQGWTEHQESKPDKETLAFQAFLFYFKTQLPGGSVLLCRFVQDLLVYPLADLQKQILGSLANLKRAALSLDKVR